jgi:hypothetical protein
MKIAVGGCSHSSQIYGKPWWFHLKEDMNAFVFSSSSGASGNEKNVEKIKYMLDNLPDLELIIYQITDPSRLVVGVETEENNISKYLNDVGGQFNVPYYTFNGHGNNQRIFDLFNVNTNIDDFFVNKVLTSDYNTKQKVFHTLMSMQYMADLYGKKIIFFSWFVDMHKLAEHSNHTKSISKMNILTGCVEDFIKANKIKRLEDKSHLGTEAHYQIYHEYLKPQLRNFIN